jgi:uncharacterized protein YbcI
MTGGPHDGPPVAGHSPGGMAEMLTRTASSGVNKRVARAVVQIHRECVGRGPDGIAAFFHRNVLVVVLRGVMSKAEQTIAESGRHDAVLRIRAEFQATMRADLVAAVEDVTGRTVLAVMSDDHVDPDMAVDVFVLDEPIGDGVDADVLDLPRGT